jgi:hydrogenase small subunit
VGLATAAHAAASAVKRARQKTGEDTKNNELEGQD